MSVSFKVELASNGRAKCKKSKEKIAKGELRVGRVAPNPFKEGETMTSWYKLLPFFEMQQKQRKTTKKLESIDELEGFDSLPEENQNAVKTALEQFLAEKDKPKPKKRKAKKEDGDAKEGTKKQRTPKKAKKAKKAKPEPKEEVKDLFADVKPGASPKEAAQTILKVAKELGFSLPSDDKAALVRAGQMLMGNKSSDGNFDYNKALKALAEELNCKDKLPGGKPKKKRPGPEAKCKENQGLIDAFWELREFEFKKQDKFKAISYIKVAKALAEVDYKVDSGKEVSKKGPKKLPGVGKAAGEKIDEFLETGQIERLEKYRRGEMD